MTENRKEIPGLTLSSIKMDLVRFKDDILKDIRAVQLTLDEKYLKADDFLKERITEFEIKVNSMDKKIIELSNLIFEDNSLKEKVQSLDQFKEDMSDQLFKRRAKFNELEKKVNNEFNRINNILIDSVIYPSLIGKTTKFKSFHDFMDYVVHEISQLIIFKDKNSLDLTPYKKKLELTIDNLKLQISNFTSKEYVDNAINKIDEKIKNLYKVYNDRLQDIQVENSQYYIGLEKRTEEMGKQTEILKKMHRYLNKKIENQQELEMINNLNNQFNFIKMRLNKINEIIKELLGYHPATKKNFMYEFETKSSKVFSGVKQYIRGNLNADELSSMKKFTYEKSKTKVYEKSFGSPTISPFSSQDFKFELDNNNNINFLFTNNNQTSFSRSKNKKKTYLSQKSLNYINQTELLAKKSNDKNSINIKVNEKKDNKDNKDNIFLKRNIYNRRNTLNVDIIKNFGSSKLVNEISKDYNENKNIKENENLNEEQNKKNNLNKSIINNDDKNQDEESKEEDKDDNNREQNTPNQSVIKEEDENALSDNSCKNLEILSKEKRMQKLNKKDKNVNNESNNIKSINNEDNNNINIIKSDINDMKLASLKKRINENLSENSNIKVMSLKIKKSGKRPDKNNANINNIINNTDIKEKNLYKNKLKLYKNINDKSENNQQMPCNNLILKLNNEENNENISRKPIKKNSSYQNMSKTPKNTPSKNSNPNSPNKVNSLSLENNNNFNKNPINYNFRSNNNNILSNNNVNKTYTYFPKINCDLSTNKIFHKNNYIESKDMNIITKTLSIAKFPNQASAKVAAYIKKPKKVLLTSPDNIPSNGYIKRNNRNIIKNNSVGVQSEKVDKTKNFENIYINANQFFIPYKIKTKEEERVKSLKNININKSP